MTYVRWWSRCWGVLAALGLAIAFVVWSPGEVAFLLTAATISVAVLLGFLLPAAGEERRPAFHWSRLASRAVVAGAAVVSVAAYAAAVPYLAWPLGFLAVATSPPVADRALRRRAGRAEAGPKPRHRTGTADGPSGDLPPTADWPDGHSGIAGSDEDAGAGPGDGPTDLTEQQVRALRTAELCHRWRHSFVALESARSAAARMRVVAQRQLFLDEMDRRSPTALAAWLASGARAAGGPERFLTDETPGRSDAA